MILNFKMYRYTDNQNFLSLFVIIRTVTKQTARVIIGMIFCFELSPFGNFAVPLSNSLFYYTL